jgi:hypothetical protein
MFHGAYGLDTGRWWRVVHFPTLWLAVAAFFVLPAHPRRGFVAAAVSGYVVVLVVTGSWFLPELLALTVDPTSPIPEDEWRARAQRWDVASLMRLALMYVNAGLLVWAAAAPPTRLNVSSE